MWDIVCVGMLVAGNYLNGVPRVSLNAKGSYVLYWIESRAV